MSLATQSVTVSLPTVCILALRKPSITGWFRLSSITSWFTPIYTFLLLAEMHLWQQPTPIFLEF